MVAGSRTSRTSLGVTRCTCSDSPTAGRLQQITTGGGIYPRWSRDGRELFFWTGAALGVVSVEAADEFRHSNPRELFKTTFAVVLPSAPYDVAPDGQRFVFIRDDSRQLGPTQVNFVQGWLGGSRR